MLGESDLVTRTFLVPVGQSLASALLFIATFAVAWRAGRSGEAAVVQPDQALP